MKFNSGTFPRITVKDNTPPFFLLGFKILLGFKFLGNKAEYVSSNLVITEGEYV